MDALTPKAAVKHLGKKIDSEADLLDVLGWAAENEGLSVTIAAQAGVGVIRVQLEGVDIPTVVTTLGDLIGNHVVFDGHTFTILTPDEFGELY